MINPYHTLFKFSKSNAEIMKQHFVIKNASKINRVYLSNFKYKNGKQKHMFSLIFAISTINLDLLICWPPPGRSPFFSLYLGSMFITFLRHKAEGLKLGSQ
jgi:hypothetical protein